MEQKEQEQRRSRVISLTIASKNGYWLAESVRYIDPSRRISINTVPVQFFDIFLSGGSNLWMMLGFLHEAVPAFHTRRQNAGIPQAEIGFNQWTRSNSLASGTSLSCEIFPMQGNKELNPDPTGYDKARC
uniref:Uncharacterized protein n=1 Tax=Nelumbo nucifera TaxID=4432 RepID=A0A822YA84_NELNU|nr:TPA_asm: hypothetical protein HUJ06_030690 [Nelumbo nucifera]